MTTPEEITRLKEVLDMIDRVEHAEGRPMMSATVVNPETGMPDSEFFDRAQELGLFAGGDDAAKREFWEAENKRVREYWEGADPNTPPPLALFSADIDRQLRNTNRGG